MEKQMAVIRKKAAIRTVLAVAAAVVEDDERRIWEGKSLPYLVGAAVCALVAIAVAGMLGGGLSGALLALGITMWTSFARLARSHTLAIKNEPYITIARLQGQSGARIMAVHIMPNILEPVLINALTQIGTTMIGISGLSFLGLGVVAPQAEWGSMISEARAYIQIAPWAVLFPAAAIVITIIIFNYLGDAVMEYRKAD